MQARIQTDSLADYTEELSEALVLFPNPAQGQVNLITDFQGKEQVTVMIYGITPMGYEKRLFKGRLENGQGQLILDVSNVPQGLYQLVVIAGGGSFIIYFYRHCLLITAQA